MGKPILCLDFDGVIHSYTSGWQGADVISDPPVEGALEFIVKALERFEVHILSSRSAYPHGRKAMQQYLIRHLSEAVREEEVAWWAKAKELLPHTYLTSSIAPAIVLDLIRWPTEKPPAFLTIDDRVIQFNGRWPSLDEIAAFKPWNKRPPLGGSHLMVDRVSENPAFTRWSFEAQSDITMDGKPVPLMTELLYRVCDGSQEKFDAAVDMLKAAFEAGRKSGGAA